MAGTITHSWNGTILTITSDSGTTAMDLKGEKGDTGARGARGLPGKSGGGARIEDGVISDETTWSSSGIIDRFAELMGTNANPAVLDNPYPNFPLQITTTFELNQSGSGEPSPTNIRQISGFNSVNIVRCGKNLAKSIYLTDNTTIYGASLFIDYDLKPSTTYTLSFVGTAGNKVYLNENLTEYNDITMSGGRESITFTTKSVIDYYGQYTNGKGWMILKNGEDLSTPTVFTDVQLELGSTATAYEPYQGDTYTTDFGQTVYGGTLDWNTGVLTVDRAFYTFDGSEGLTSGGWNNPYSYVLWSFLPDVVNCGMPEVADAYCSHYIVRSVTNVITNVIAGFGIYDSGHLIFSSPTHANVDAFKSYLAAQNAAGTPVQVCYKLATPQIIQLTPQEIKAIKGINTLTSNAQELTVIGRVDTMYQLSKLAERVAALESR